MLSEAIIKISMRCRRRRISYSEKGEEGRTPFGDRVTCRWRGAATIAQTGAPGSGCMSSHWTVDSPSSASTLWLELFSNCNNTKHPTLNTEWETAADDVQVIVLDRFVVKPTIKHCSIWAGLAKQLPLERQSLSSTIAKRSEHQSRPRSVVHG